jgi:hypothetical protein
MGVVIQIHVFLTKIVVEGEWSASRPCSLTPLRGKISGTIWLGGGVGASSDLDDLEKILDPTGTRSVIPSPVQPVASLHTDWAIFIFCFTAVAKLS